MIYRNVSRLVCCLIVAAAACGGDSDDFRPFSMDGGPLPDASMGTDGSLTVATVFAVGTDYLSSGIATTIEMPSMDIHRGILDGVASTDPVVRHIDDRVYIVNRLADNLTVIDANSLTLVEQVTTGSGTNPQDVAFHSGKLYVAALGAPGVLVLDTADFSSGVTSTIDLAELDPEDGKPNCNSLAATGDRLFVSCGVLDDTDPFLTARGPGKVAVVDLTNDELVSTLDLSTANPFGFLEADGTGNLLVATVPNFGDPTEGCVQRIQTAGTVGVECAVENRELSGYASGISGPSDELWIAVTEGFADDFKPLGKLVRVVDGAVMPAVTPAEQRAFDVAACPNGSVVIADASGGLRVYDSAGVELTSDVLDIGMPPVPGGIVCF